MPRQLLSCRQLLWYMWSAMRLWVVRLTWWRDDASVWSHGHDWGRRTCRMDAASSSAWFSMFWIMNFNWLLPRTQDFHRHAGPMLAVTRSCHASMLVLCSSKPRVNSARAAGCCLHARCDTVQAPATQLAKPSLYRQRPRLSIATCVFRSWYNYWCFFFIFVLFFIIFKNIWNFRI